MIVIVPYDDRWPGLFAEEAQRIRSEFGADAIRVSHVGSTSVAGLDAKPVIDIQVSVASLSPRRPLDEHMRKLGYTHIDYGDFDKVYPFFRLPATWPSTHHVHLCDSGAEEERRHLAFRDFLRANPEACSTYVKLKRHLASIHHGTTRESRERYSNGKSEFVESMLERAYAQGYPLAHD